MSPAFACSAPAINVSSTEFLSHWSRCEAANWKRIYRSFSSNLLSPFYISVITSRMFRCSRKAQPVTKEEPAMDMFSRSIPDGSRNSVIEYGLIACLVVAIVILRVTM
jgi:hypothetical protein